MTDPIYVKWSFLLYPDLDSLVAAKDPNRSKKRPGLINRTEVTGFLTKNRLGVVVSPGKDLIAGYYLVGALSMTGLEHFGSGELLDRVWDRYSSLLALVYMDSTMTEPEVIGVLDRDTWEEECLTKATVALTYRVPAPHGDEYREKTTELDIPQVTAITERIWHKLRDWRLDEIYLTCPHFITFENGEEWVPDTTRKYLPVPEHEEV